MVSGVPTTERAHYLSGLATGLPLVCVLRVWSKSGKNWNAIAIKASAVIILVASICTDTIAYADTSSVGLFTFQGFVQQFSIQVVRTCLLSLCVLRATAMVDVLKPFKWWILTVAILVQGVPGMTVVGMMTENFNCIAYLTLITDSPPPFRCMTTFSPGGGLDKANIVGGVSDDAFAILAFLFDFTFVTSLFLRLSKSSSASPIRLFLSPRVLHQLLLYVAIFGCICWVIAGKARNAAYNSELGMGWKFLNALIFITVAEFGLDVEQIVKDCRMMSSHHHGGGGGTVTSSSGQGTEPMFVPPSKMRKESMQDRKDSQDTAIRKTSMV